MTIVFRIKDRVNYKGRISSRFNVIIYFLKGSLQGFLVSGLIKKITEGVLENFFGFSHLMKILTQARISDNQILKNCVHKNQSKENSK